MRGPPYGAPYGAPHEDSFLGALLRLFPGGPSGPGVRLGAPIVVMWVYLPQGMAANFCIAGFRGPSSRILGGPPPKQASVGGPL